MKQYFLIKYKYVNIFNRMLPESPRWLMSKGRVDEAQKTLLRAAKTNGKKVSDVDSRLKKIMAKATEVGMSLKVRSCKLKPGLSPK